LYFSVTTWVLRKLDGRMWTQDRDQWQALVNMVTNLQLHKRRGISWLSEQLLKKDFVPWSYFFNIKFILRLVSVLYYILWTGLNQLRPLTNLLQLLKCWTGREPECEITLQTETWTEPLFQMVHSANFTAIKFSMSNYRGLT
jgi:hypothetical protein